MRTRTTSQTERYVDRPLEAFDSFAESLLMLTVHFSRTPNSDTSTKKKTNLWWLPEVCARTALCHSTMESMMEASVESDLHLHRHKSWRSIIQLANLCEKEK